MRRPDLLAGTVVAIALCAVLGAVAPSVAPASALKPAKWTLETFFTEPITVAGEGVASYPGGRRLFRGFAQVPTSVSQLGFNHVGDEDIDRSGDVYDAYEDDHPDPTAKLFTITAPNGRVSDYPHPLAQGEEYNNSFVTVSPNDRWLVSGEWNTERRLLLFSNPKGRPSGSSIPLAGTIALRSSLYHVQGCDFFDAVTLICSTDNAVHAVVKVSLSRPLHRGTNTATDRRLLIPREVSKCPGTGFESEGVDYNARTGRLTLTMNEPGSCVGTTDVNVYKLAHGPRGPAIGTPLANGTPMPAGSTVGGALTFTVPVDATAAGGRPTTTITLSRGGQTLASNRDSGHGTRRSANPNLIASELADGSGYELRITSVAANGRSARARVAFAVNNPT
ncbi:MAG: hypothetical protein WAK93_22620 [Solirubrobacteraceae bacterium]